LKRSSRKYFFLIYQKFRTRTVINRCAERPTPNIKNSLQASLVKFPMPAQSAVANVEKEIPNKDKLYSLPPKPEVILH
jgi:hypothetical protein